MFEYLKKSLKWILYFSGIFFVTISVNSFQKEDLICAIAFLVISFATYSFLIIKDYKFLSVISYITLMVSITTVLAFAGGDIPDGGTFATANYEKAFYLTLGILVPLIISLCTYLIKMGGWRKTISRIILVISIVALFIMGIASPTFHNNFVYTRISIGTIFVYSIYLIFKKEKLPRIKGIIGILSSILALLFSAVWFSTQIYTIKGGEKEQVVSFMEPKVQEMFQSYNQRNFKGFYKHYTEGFKAIFNEESFESLRNMYGSYISHEEPEITFKGGTYYIEYPINFSIMSPIYFTFETEQVTPDSGIRGFNSSPEKALKIQEE